MVGKLEKMMNIAKQKMPESTVLDYLKNVLESMLKQADFIMYQEKQQYHLQNG